MSTTGPEELARRVGFKPYAEFDKNQQLSIEAYVEKWYKNNGTLTVNASRYWWHESSPGDGNWIANDVRPATLRPTT